MSRGEISLQGRGGRRVGKSCGDWGVRGTVVTGILAVYAGMVGGTPPQVLRRGLLRTTWRRRSLGGPRAGWGGSGRAWGGRVSNGFKPAPTLAGRGGVTLTPALSRQGRGGRGTPPQVPRGSGRHSRVDETLAGTSCQRRHPPHPSLLPPGEKVQETRRCPMVTDTNTPNLNSYGQSQIPHLNGGDAPNGKGRAGLKPALTG